MQSTFWLYQFTFVQTAFSILHPEAQIGSLQRGPDQPSWQSYIHQVRNIYDKLTYALAQQDYTDDSWTESVLAVYQQIWAIFHLLSVVDFVYSQ